MALRIRLARMGAKKKPFYRIVVAASESPRNGRFIEILGNYDPKKEPAEINFKKDRVLEWLSRGAEPTLTVSHLLQKKGISVKQREADAAL
ncbi:MAG: 30S ribosomal protein S16 [Syntrophales bacterium]